VSSIQIRPLRHDEIESFARLGHYAFDGRSIDLRLTDFTRRVRAERNCLVVVEDGTIVSQLMIYEIGTWIEGISYPTGGLANIATAPERTRKGHASRLLRAAFAWMRDELGQSVCTLFPTLQPLYAGLGCALADTGTQFVAPAASFRPAASLPRDSGGWIERRPARVEDVDLLDAVYRRFAAPRSGYIDRPRWYWEEFHIRPHRPVPTPWLGIWRGSDGEVAGYVEYTQREGPPQHLRVSDLVAIRPEAYRGLLEFLAAHHLWGNIHLYGGSDVPWLQLVANPHEFQIHIDPRDHMLVRVIDLQRAISARRVRSTGLVPDIHLRVRDADAPWNDGVWRVGIRERAGGASWTTERSDPARPDAELDVAVLASLFFGYTTTRQARDVGALAAADGAIPTLDALFHTSYPPHCQDHF
jgi:predicted acetyltransferase